MRALVTGGTGGLGAGVARQLAEAGWHVTIAGRDHRRGQAAAAELGGTFVAADLSMSAGVRSLAKAVTDPLDALVLCAGVVSFSREVQKTGDGHELTFATNYLSRYALVHLLRDVLTPTAHVVMAGGDGRHRGVSTDWSQPAAGIRAARKAALAVDLFAVELARQAPDRHVHTCYPGMVRTDLLRSAPGPVRAVTRLLGVPVEQGSGHLTRLVLGQHAGVAWRKDEPMGSGKPLPEADPGLWSLSDSWTRASERTPR